MFSSRPAPYHDNDYVLDDKRMQWVNRRDFTNF